MAAEDMDMDDADFGDDDDDAFGDDDGFNDGDDDDWGDVVEDDGFQIKPVTIWIHHDNPSPSRNSNNMPSMDDHSMEDDSGISQPHNEQPETEQLKKSPPSLAEGALALGSEVRKNNSLSHIKR
eukprot:743524_1